MSDAKFVNISMLITAYNLQIDNEVLPDNLKCIKCKLVLQDACAGPCGCRLCRVCIDDLMASGSEFCPGVSEDCGESILSDFTKDFRANKSVCKLTVKCPQNECFHKCQLDELEEHMRVCGRKSVACPFHEFGCQQSKLSTEEMSGHFHQENRSHCEILIGMIADINREMESHKREIEMLKTSDESRKNENEMLKRELVLKDEKIKKILDQMGHVENEIESIKREKADLIDRVQILSEKIEREIDERRKSYERDMANVMKHLGRQIIAITALIRSNKNEMDTAIRPVRDDIRSINHESIKSIKDDIHWIKSRMKSIQALAGLGQIDASFEWTIDEVIDKSDEDENIYESVDDENLSMSKFYGKHWTRVSNHFLGGVDQYKYRLECRNDGISGSLLIYLHILPGASDAHLQWPFSGRVAITVADMANRDACQSVAVHCKIRRPPDNQYRISAPCKFSHFSLTNSGLYLPRGIRVSCVIIPSSTV